MKEYNDFSLEYRDVFPGSYSISLVVNGLLVLLHSQVHTDLSGGDKKFYSDRNLVKLHMLLSNYSVNPLQLRLTLIDTAQKLGKLMSVFK